MKKLVLFFAAVIVFPLGLLFASGAQDESKVDMELTVYSPAPKELIDLVIPAFEKETGAKVYVIEAGTGQIFNRIKAEAGYPQADIVLTGGIDSAGAFRDYLTEYVSSEDANMIQSAKETPWYNAMFLNPMGIIFNKNLVDDGDVNSWIDLTNSEWEGKVLMPDPRKSGSAFGELTIFLHAYGRDGEAWSELIEPLHKNLVITTSSSHTYKFVASGEYPLGLTHEKNAFKYSNAGEPVGFIYPSDGTAIRPDGVYLVKDGPNPELAKKFIDFVLSKEMMMQLGELGYRTNRKDVDPPAGFPDIDVITLCDYDPIWASENRESLLDQWTKLEESK